MALGLLVVCSAAGRRCIGESGCARSLKCMYRQDSLVAPVVVVMKDPLVLGVGLLFFAIFRVSRE